MKTFLSTLVAASVLATAVVSVQLHLRVAQLRYTLWSLEERRTVAERELRLARADLESAKAPRRLLERWAELRGDVVARTPPTAKAAAARPPDAGDQIEDLDEPAERPAASDKAGGEDASRPAPTPSTTDAPTPADAPPADDAPSAGTTTAPPPPPPPIPLPESPPDGGPPR